MAVTKNKSVYVCQSCGYESAKWYGAAPTAASGTR